MLLFKRHAISHTYAKSESFQNKTGGTLCPGIQVKSADITASGTSLLKAMEMREEEGGRISRIKNVMFYLQTFFVKVYLSELGLGQDIA